MSPTSYRTALPRDTNTIYLLNYAYVKGYMEN